MKNRLSTRSSAGSGSVYPDARGFWVAAVSIGPRNARKRRKQFAKSEAEAWELLRRMNAEPMSVAQLADGKISVETFLDAWLDEVIRPTVRPKTHATYESVLRTHAYPKIGTLRLDRVRHEHCRQLFIDLEREGVGPRLRQVTHLRLTTAFGSAVGRAFTTNPMADVPRPRVARRSMSVWSAEQARTFLAAIAGDPLAAMYRLVLSVGLRRGEALALRWEDVDLKAGRLHVRHTLTDEGELAEPKTPGSRRPIELPGRSVTAVARASSATSSRRLPGVKRVS